jgi:hypothetical protein
MTSLPGRVYHICKERANQCAMALELLTRTDVIGRVVTCILQLECRPRHVEPTSSPPKLHPLTTDPTIFLAH